MKIEQSKPHSIHLRLNEEQYDFLKEISTNADVGISDMLRMILNTVMVTSRKAGVVEPVQSLDAKLGEPHADNQNAI